jgi:hypothetical protein
MIPAEIVAALAIAFFAVRWLMGKERNHELRQENDRLKARVQELEVENASLSGALTERRRPGGDKSWTNKPGL